MKTDKLYIAIISICFGTFAVVFSTFPRSTWSELEKRELAKFPAFSIEKLADGSFARDVSSWFSDSEPYRDRLMALSMQIDNMLKLETSGESITFHASGQPQTAAAGNGGADAGAATAVADSTEDMADENAKIANAGIIIVGSGQNVRALMAYGGGPGGCTAYAQAANAYKEAFGADVNVYCMVVPTAVEFYLPEKAKRCSQPQLPTIKNVNAHLNPGVIAVDAYSALAAHKDEDIYLRTDHHWAPLGAFYAAEAFAKAAGVPFRQLSAYRRRVVHRYVGSMYGYSKDISVKNAPEDFVYYVPEGVKYTTTFTTYDINEKYQITGEHRPVRGAFFQHYRDGHGGAYCTFMGGDTKITKVATSTANGRRVLILKDSFGNAIPGYLFYSFEEVHVVDSRYFSKNMRHYVHDNKITDILFANNIFKAYSPATYRAYIRFLNQNPLTAADYAARRAADSLRADTLKAAADSMKARKPAKAVSEPKPAGAAAEGAGQAATTVEDTAEGQGGSREAAGQSAGEGRTGAVQQ